MRTPFGAECEFFYGDYLRGRHREECRLLGAAGLTWDQSLCETCPVPGIRRANACKSVQLKPRIARPLLAFFRKRVMISAFCEKSQGMVTEPHIGCGQCHPIPPVFEVKK